MGTFTYRVGGGGGGVSFKKKRGEGVDRQFWYTVYRLEDRPSINRPVTMYISVGTKSSKIFFVYSIM
jgi:hypothetical protein